MSGKSSKDFWNRKAKENALWYVSSVGPYQGRDEQGFWESGQKIWHHIRSVIGYSPRKSDTVVEIGCGVGRLTRAISPDVGELIAQDISEEMLEITKGHGLPNVTYLCTDGFNLKALDNASADVILAYCVFQHLPSLSALGEYLREMARVAKPDGRIAFTLQPRGFIDAMLPLLKVRRRLVEAIFSSGPRELWRPEWVGIRPSIRRVLKLSPVPLVATDLGNGRILFHGTGQFSSTKD